MTKRFIRRFFPFYTQASTTTTVLDKPDCLH